VWVDQERVEAMCTPSNLYVVTVSTVWDAILGITNLCYTDDVILLATSEAELQELVDRLDRVSHKYILLINIDKTKVVASNGIACGILIQNEQPDQVTTFQYLGSLITEDGECTTEFRTWLNRGQAIGASLQKIWKSQRTDL